MESTTKLFVYGSLRSGFQSNAYHYISHYFKLLGTAKVSGQLFDLGEYPAAKPAPGTDSFILGELYELNEKSAFSWVFGQLDDYEGVVAEEGETVMYRRELTTAFINSHVETAWIYWYNGEVTDKPLVASGDIVEYFKNKKK